METENIELHYAPDGGTLFPENIETTSLSFEPLSRDNIDVLELYGLLGKGETIEAETRYLNWSAYDSPYQTKQFLEKTEEHWQEGTKASYILRSREQDDGVVGFTTLSIEWGRRLGEFGIFLRKPFWGRGYSQQRARAMIYLAFDQLDLEVIEVSCSIDNDRAKRAIEKYVDEFGGEYVGVRYNMVTDDTDEPLDCHLYTITDEQYRETTATSPNEVGPE